MNNKSVFKEESVEIMNENRDFIKFIENGIETGNPEVINNIPITDLRNACTNSQPSNQEKEINPERPIIFHGYDLNTNISNDQRFLINIPSHTSHEYETGKEGKFTFNDNEMRNICDNITRGINEPKIYQTMNSSQVYGINYGNMQTRQDLLQNSESSNKTPCMDDFSWKESATNQMAFERNCLTGIDNEFQTTKESPSLNQGMQVFDNVGKNPLFAFGQKIASNTSISEIVQDYHEPIKISDSMTSNCSRENMLTFPGQYSYPRNMNNPNLGTDNAFQTIKESSSLNQKLQVLGDLGKNALFTVGDITASNTSISEIARNDHEPSEISDSMKSICSRENMLSIPDSTGYHWNENNTNLLGDKLQSLHQAEKGKVLTCKVCKAKIADHKHRDVENIFYECCICNYNYNEPSNLHLHSITHVHYKFCNICLKEHTEGDSHDGAKKCIVPLCGKTFHCRTELKEHFLGHKDYFKGHCWECCKSFGSHRNRDEGKIFYACCLCEDKMRDKEEWVKHKNTHRPKLFCKLCKEEYPAEEKGSHQNEFTCIVCERNFKCKGLFEQHSIDHEGYFYTQCRVCDKNVYDHEIPDQSYIFKCCICPQSAKQMSDLRRHLYKHFDFKVYKCDTCGERFKRRICLDKHSESCPAVPYNCESCPAKFPRREFLDLHCSVKHKV